MILDRVTITGADDSIDPSALVELSETYPFVEWGILFAKHVKTGGVHNAVASRFPTHEWVGKLMEVATPEMKLSAHLCAGWVYDLLAGRYTFGQIQEFDPYRFQRAQINFHGEPIISVRNVAVMREVNLRTKLLYQCDGVNNDTVLDLVLKGMGCPLFDTSSGAGVLPKEWPQIWNKTYCGYAGGLGPSNIAEQIAGPIAKATVGGRIWVDLETRVRSDRDRQFDLDLVKTVCKQVAPLVNG